MARPLPPRFWRWCQWRLGHGPWRGKGPRSQPRPSEFPRAIPPRWWIAWRRYFEKPKPPTPPPPRPLTYAFFQRDSCWVNHPDGANPDVLVPLMQRGGQSLVIVQVLDGTEHPSTPDTSSQQWMEMTARYTRGLKDRGIAVAGWGWGRGHFPEDEADRAWGVCVALGLDAYVHNGEKPYEGGGKSGRFVRRFRSLAGASFPLGWSPEPQLALDHHILQAESVCYMPQAYLGENRWDVEGCVNIGLRFGYKLDQQVPLVSVHDGTPPEAHVNSARRVGVKHLCLYPTNACLDRPGVFEVLGSL